MTDYQGNNIAVIGEDGSVIDRMGYYPYGLPWNTPTSTDYLFADKEYQHLGGLDEYIHGARRSVPYACVFSTPDDLCEKRSWESPYIFCGGNPVNMVDPDGYRPIYSPDGTFLGTDDSGLQGAYILMNQNDFQQGMTEDEALNFAVDESDVSEKAMAKIGSHFRGLPSRPDYDGYITLNEANEWYQNGTGEPLYADLSKNDLSDVELALNDFVGDEITPNISVLSKKWDDALVYGHIRLIVGKDDFVTAKPDTYDFDMHKGHSFDTIFRNILTKIGSWVAGKGIEYEIRFYGKQKLTRHNFYRRK